MGSLILSCADATRVEAGGALAVDRHGFAALVAERIRNHPRIRVVPGEVTALPEQGEVVVASGPLTSDALAQALLTSMESGKESIPWIFTAFPSQTFKDNFGSALLEYAQGTMDWEQVKQTVIEQWQIEKEAAK